MPSPPSQASRQRKTNRHLTIHPSNDVALLHNQSDDYIKLSKKIVTTGSNRVGDYLANHFIKSAMSENPQQLSPVCEEDIHRFLFSSSSNFRGAAKAPSYHLCFAFPAFQSNQRMMEGNPSPYRVSCFSLSIRVPVEEPSGTFQIIQTYSWMPEQVAVLLTAFFGKLIRSHGHIQKGCNVMVPDLTVPHTPAFASPPFNDKPRKPCGPKLNLQHASSVIDGYFSATSEDTILPKLLSACTFYHLALENWVTRPILSYTSLVSSVEALLDLMEYSDSDLFDGQRIKDFLAIKSMGPEGPKIASRFRASLYSVKRKFVKFIENRIPPEFFEEKECEEYSCIKRKLLKKTIKSAYDVRSKYLHTGDTMGFNHLTRENERSEIVIGTPNIPNKDRQKLVESAPTLSGLERLVSALLRAEISRWLSTPESSIPLGSDSIKSEPDSMQQHTKTDDSTVL